MADKEYYIKHIAEQMRPEAFDLHTGSNEAQAYAYELATDFFNDFMGELELD